MTDSASPVIRPMSAADIPFAVDLHLAVFPGLFLSNLGAPFLRTFYRGFLEQPSAIALIVEHSGRPAGMVVGAGISHAFFRRLLLSRWYAFAAASLPAVLRSPGIAFRLVRNVSRVRPLPAPRRAEIMYLAVQPGAANRGFGAQLIQAFFREALAYGATSAELNTPAQNNDVVNKYYISRGFRLDHTFITREGRPMNKFVYDFAASRPANPAA